jgi:NodT family efflux transporter outer membrane factor (OMF) lipoprotein
MRRTALALALAMAGCTVGPDYEKPETPTPQAWGEKVDTSTADLSRWWTVFKDPVLERLVAQAIEANHDLRIAGARIRESRANLGIASGALLPEVNLSGSVTRVRISENASRFPDEGLYSNLYTGGFGASWELDLFGGLRRAVEAATADYEATVVFREAVRVSLLGELASNYVGLRGSQRLRAVLRENVATARATAELIRARIRAGLATDFDLARAESLVANAEAQLPLVEASLRRSLHRIGVLAGREPRALAAELEPEGPIPAAPPAVIVGLPSELLRRRPDIHVAERQLAAATARIGEATAELFPKISLTGAFGLESFNSSDFFEAASRAGVVGPVVRWPIFAGGRIRASIDAANARQEQALAEYEKSILGALEEVENTLVGYLREGDRRRSISAAADADRRAVRLSDDLYKKGLASFLEVLDAQQNLYATQAELARSEAGVSLALVALYRALGGGWEPPQS